MVRTDFAFCPFSSKVLEVHLLTSRRQWFQIRQERARYIAPAKSAGFTVVGYFFQSRVADALRRNSGRGENERVPDKGVLGASGRLEIPSKAEGFDQWFFVRLKSVAEKNELLFKRGINFNR